MKVISVNIGERKLVQWKQKSIETGIFKYPVHEAIHLGDQDVDGDAVVDRKYHGGIEKAAYIFSADHYPYWKKLYPELDWNWGMFGENITIEGLDEKKLTIGDLYALGTAQIEITSPREPCFKLGIRFNNQSILKAFIKVPHCGSYVKVIQKGKVAKGDKMQLIKKGDGLTIADTYLNLYR